MRIIDACIEVLNRAGKPLTSDEIYDEIVKYDLYRFGAKEPRNILRGTIRKHIRNNQQPRLTEVRKGVYQKA